jgi:hypothetical protein
MKTSQKKGPNGVLWGVVNNFLDQLQPLNSCLAELAQLTASGEEPPTPALLDHLSGQYEGDGEIHRRGEANDAPADEGGAS